MPRPVAAGHRAVAGRPDAGPGRLLDPVRAGAGAQPARARSTGDARPGRCGSGCTPSWPPRATRATSCIEELVTPLDWQRRAWRRARRSRWPTPSPRPARSGPRNVERRLPGMFFAGSGTVPGVGVPMVLISGKLAADRVGNYLPERCPMSDVRSEVCARATGECAQADLAVRHHLLLGRRAAAQAAAQARATRSTPCAGWPTTSSTCPTPPT